MGDQMSSRERMLAALSGKKPDHVPCCFMLFGAMRKKSRDPLDYVSRQLDMGLDAYVELPGRPIGLARETSEHYDLYGLPVRFGTGVTVSNWTEGENMIHREYLTPSGRLVTTVIRTDDWVHGDRVPLFDDYVIPRARKRLITGRDDLGALRHLLIPPSADEIRAFRDDAKRARRFAADRDVVTAGAWGVLFDAACWLCGMEELSQAAIEDPEFLDELLEIIHGWNAKRMEILLDERPDLMIRRSWYETVDMLSPANYRRFILPPLQKDARQCHAAGCKLAIITTSAYTPLLDLYIESGVDALIGLDPVQDSRADFALTKGKLGGKIGLWGGVNGFVTVERGTDDDVRKAVRDAARVLAPGGGFILSPVDNVRDDGPLARANVEAFIDEWTKVRDQY